MTNAVLSQLPIEVLQASAQANVQISQLPVEVLQTSPPAKVIFSQVIVEVLRPNGTYVDKKRVINISC